MLELGAWYWTHFVLKSSETHIFQMGLAGVTGHRHHTRHWRRGWAGQRPGDPGAELLVRVTTVTSLRGHPWSVSLYRGWPVCAVSSVQSRPLSLRPSLTGSVACLSAGRLSPPLALTTLHSGLLRPGWAPLSNVSLCCLSSECRLLGCQARLSPVLAEAGGL